MVCITFFQMIQSVGVEYIYLEGNAKQIKENINNWQN